jgi:hypothetical protein
MFPLLKPDEEVLVNMRAYRKSAPLVGDIVVALHPSRKGLEIIKRVAAVNPDGSFHLKGENPFETSDYRALPAGKILGKVIARFG